MSDWIATDIKQLQETHKKPADEADIQIILSPFDVPEALRGFYDTKASRCIVEFRYGDIDGDGESLIAQRPDDRITIKIGAHSRRIYRIEVKGDPDACVSVSTSDNDLDEVLMRMSENVKSWRESANYSVAKDLFKSRQKELFESGCHTVAAG